MIIIIIISDDHSDGKVVSGTDCSVNGASSGPTWLQVFSAVQGHCPTRFLGLFEELFSNLG